MGLHLRILEFPEGIQRFFAEEIVPIEGERPLRGITKVSPRVAECVCEMAKRRKVKPNRFVSSFADLLLEAAGASFDDSPTMIPVPRVKIAEAVVDRELRENIRGRVAALYPGDTIGVDSSFLLADEEIDAARAAGCLIEYEPRKGEYVSRSGSSPMSSSRLTSPTAS